MRRLLRDGVALALEEAGAGDPALVLLHGIACDHTHFGPQIDHFARRHRVVAADLRGHGSSDAPEGVYSTELLADDVAWLIDRLSLGRPVVVGHSLGGVVALALAARHPDLPEAIVALDSPLIPPPERQAQMEDFFERLRGAGYEEEVGRYFSGLFGENDDPARRRRIVERATGAPRHAVTSAWEQGALHFDTPAAALACRVPFLYVDAGTPNAQLDRLGELCPALTLGRTVGAGHFHQLEVPDQVNAMLERFLDSLHRTSAESR
jgi:pimeloyl-ACP methyl ester carboxylesterase